MDIAHITLHVTDLDRSISFYSELGLPLARRFGPPGREIAFMGDGATKLELISDGNGVPAEGVSFGFYVPDAETLARKLDEKCVGPVSPAPGVVFWFVRDPDGFTVQILQE